MDLSRQFKSAALIFFILQALIYSSDSRHHGKSFIVSNGEGDPEEYILNPAPMATTSNHRLPSRKQVRPPLPQELELDSRLEGEDESPPTPRADVIFPGERAAALEPKKPEEVAVSSSAGRVAVLRCFATGNPPPIVSWRRDGVLIDTNKGPYVLTSSGDLTIVQVHQSDSGLYICEATNGLGAPVSREVNLQVSDAKTNILAYIYGPENVTQIVTIKQPAIIRCPAGAFPEPHVNWWRWNNRTHLTTIRRYDTKRDYSLVFSSIELSDLGPYECTAWTGHGKPVSMVVVLKAIGPVNVTNRNDEPFLKYILNPVPMPTTSNHPSVHPSRKQVRPPLPQEVEPDSSLEGEDEILTNPSYKKLVSATSRIRRDLSNNSYIVFNCDVKGYPAPNVTWYKDRKQIFASNRVQITENPYRLFIYAATAEDSGSYVCKAINTFGLNTTLNQKINATALIRRDLSNNYTLGSDIVLNCDVEGYPAPNVTWYKNSKQIFASNRVQITENPYRLVIYAFTAEDSGYYVCKTKNTFSFNTTLNQKIQTINENDIEVKPDEQKKTTNRCESFGEQCRTLQCPFGTKSIDGSDGCRRCECMDPCANYSCPNEEKCAVDVSMSSDPSLEARFIPICRHTRKPGDCPKLLNNFGCHRECYDDADCRDDNKCCSEGCSHVCVRPHQSRLQTTTTRPSTPRTDFIFPGEIVAALEPKKPEEVAAVTVSATALIRRDLSNKYTVGSDIVLNCDVQGYPAPNVTWSKDSKQIFSSNRVRINENPHRLVIYAVTAEDSGDYGCTARNTLGSNTSEEKILIEFNATALIRRDLSNKYTLGSDIVLNCDVQGYPAPNVTWSKDSKQIFSSNRVRITENPHRLVIYAVTAEDSGDYGCTARNTLGLNTSHEKILIESGIYVRPDCTDYKYFARNCPRVVDKEYCLELQFAKLCCRSCTLAGHSVPR